RKVEAAQPFGIGEDVNLNDPPSLNRKTHDRKRLAARQPGNDSSGPIDEHRLRRGGKSGEGKRLLGHSPGATDFPGRAERNKTAVGSNHDMRIEYSEKRVEVAGSSSSEKGINNFTLAAEVRIGDRRRFLYPAASAAGKLPGRRR